MVDAPAKGRVSNYIMHDGILLRKTWFHVSMDATVATDQTRDTYWSRMKEHIDAQNMSGNDRIARSLCSRWSVINGDCQKWAASPAAVDNLNPSGTNDRDR